MIDKGYGERIDNALTFVIDKSKSCWYLRDLLYYIYAKPQRLETKGAQLLYFQPPITYHPHPVIKLRLEPLSSDDQDESFSSFLLRIGACVLLGHWRSPPEQSNNT